jgi:hypothetical protein
MEPTWNLSHDNLFRKDFAPSKAQMRAGRIKAGPLCSVVNRKAKYIWGIMVGLPFTEDGMWSGGNLDRRTLSLQFHTALPTGHEQHCSTTRAAAKWETMGGGWGGGKWISLIRTHIVYHTFCLNYTVASCWIRFALKFVFQILIRFRIEE